MRPKRTKIVAIFIFLLLLTGSFGISTEIRTSQKTGKTETINKIFFPFWRFEEGNYLVLYESTEEEPFYAIESFLLKHHYNNVPEHIWYYDSSFCKNLWGISWHSSHQKCGLYRPFAVFGGEYRLYDFLEQRQKMDRTFVKQLVTFFENPEAAWVEDWRRKTLLEEYRNFLKLDQKYSPFIIDKEPQEVDK